MKERKTERARRRERDREDKSREEEKDAGDKGGRKKSPPPYSVNCLRLPLPLCSV